MKVYLNGNVLMDVQSDNLGNFFEKLDLIKKMYEMYKLYIEIDDQVLQEDHNIYISENIESIQYCYIKIFDEFENAIDIVEALMNELTILENKTNEVADSFYINNSNEIWNDLTAVFGNLERVFKLVFIATHIVGEDEAGRNKVQKVNDSITTLNSKFIMLTDFMRVKDTVAIADILKWEVAKGLEQMNEEFAGILIGGSDEE